MAFYCSRDYPQTNLRIAIYSKFSLFFQVHYVRGPEGNRTPLNKFRKFICVPTLGPARLLSAC